MKDFWESLVDDSYDFEREWIRSDDASIEECIEALSPIYGPALEIGSGTGLLARAVSEKGIEVTGIDISESLIEYAQRTPSNVKYLLCSGDGYIPIDVPDEGWYNTVYSAFVFQHCDLETVHTYIAEAHRCLVAGGALTFQYVTDCERSELSFPHKPEMIAALCEETGFKVVSNKQKLIPEWNWIWCRKEGSSSGR